MVSAQACWKGILATHEISSFSLSKSFCWFLSVLTSDFHKSTLLWKVGRSRVVRKWNSGQGSSVCTCLGDQVQTHSRLHILACTMKGVCPS